MPLILKINFENITNLKIISLTFQFPRYHPWNTTFYVLQLHYTFSHINQRENQFNGWFGMFGEENKGILMEDSQNQGCHRHCSEHPEGTAWFEFHMELPSQTEPFQLDQAVCSHGFFMMAPNHWDPLSKTLTRPLLLPNPSSSPSSLLVSLSQRPQSLAVRVHAVHFISPQQQRHIEVLNSLKRSLLFALLILNSLLPLAGVGSDFENAAVVPSGGKGREGV